MLESQKNGIKSLVPDIPACHHDTLNDLLDFL